MDRRQMLSLLVASLTVSNGTRIANAAVDDATFDLLQAVVKGEAFAMMRHAIAPGTGDPPNFDVHDCATQRNLSDDGRSQARNIGNTLRQCGLAKANVFSSQWCRCLETASLLGLASETELPYLNSFFAEREREEAQMARLRDWLKQKKGEAGLILVTHQVVISALTGVFPSSGEVLVLAHENGGNHQVLGSFTGDI